MFPISLVMIVKDEEDVLEDCLKSVQNIVSQIVIVDTGSTDGTLNIARKYTDDIFHFEWVNDFSAARNFGISKATQSWVLSLDADESIERWSSEEFVQSLNEDCVISLRSIHEFHRNDQLMEQIVYQPRLFLNLPEYRYFESIHEELRFQSGPIQTKRTEITFRHIGYRKERISKKDKITRNVDVHLFEHEKDPTNPKHLFRAAKTAFHANEYQLAKTLLEKVMEVEIPDKQMFATILIDYGYSCHQINSPDQALSIILENTEPIQDCAEIWYVLGLLFLSKKTIKDVQSAEECFQLCLKAGESSQFICTIGTGTFLPLYNLGLIYEILDPSRANEYFRLAEKYGYESSRRGG